MDEMERQTFVGTFAKMEVKQAIKVAETALLLSVWIGELNDDQRRLVVEVMNAEVEGWQRNNHFQRISELFH